MVVYCISTLFLQTATCFTYFLLLQIAQFIAVLLKSVVSFNSGHSIGKRTPERPCLLLAIVRNEYCVVQFWIRSWRKWLYAGRPLRSAHTWTCTDDTVLV